MSDLIKDLDRERWIALGMMEEIKHRLETLCSHVTDKLIWQDDNDMDLIDRCIKSDTARVRLMLDQMEEMTE